MKLLHSKLIKHENKNRENFNDFEILSLDGRYWQSKSSFAVSDGSDL